MARYLATLVLACLVILPAVIAVDYPNCPLTGKPPKKLTVPGTRCTDAAEYSCCDDCMDIWYALNVMSTNTTQIIQAFIPTFPTSGKGLTVSISSWTKL